MTGQAELDRQIGQGEDVVGIDRERLFAETVTRFRFLPDISAFLYGRLALEGQVLGVRICRRRPIEASGLNLGELIIHRARQMVDDLVLRLQQISAGGVELLGPDLGAAVGVDELGVDPHLIAAGLHRAFEHVAHA